MKERNSKIEFLRMLSMFMIVIWHATGHGGVLEACKADGGLTYYIIDFIKIVTIPATNIFVIISGYFLVESHFKIKKLVLLWLEVFFYSVLLYFLTALLGTTELSLIGIIRAICPVSFGQGYWFIKTYMGMFVFSPFFNIAIQNMNKKTHILLLAIMIVLFAVVTSIPEMNTLNSEGQHSILWFTVLYFTGAYLKKYPVQLKKSMALLGALAMYLFIFVSEIVLEKISYSFGFEGRGTGLFTMYNTLPVFLAAVFIFLACSGQDFSGKFLRMAILSLSGSTFAIYLIHDNMYLRPQLWQFMSITRFKDSAFLPIILLAAGILIYSVCIVIDKLTWTPLSRLFKKIDFSHLQAKIDSFLG